MMRPSLRIMRDEIGRATQALVSSGDFIGTRWNTAAEAQAEFHSILERLERFDFGVEAHLRDLIAPDGDFAKVAVSNGWEAEAKRLSATLRRALNEAMDHETRRAAAQPSWTVAANILPDERGGRDPGQKYTGTPIFRAGAKVFIGEVYWGRADSSHVIGIGRGSHKLVNCVVRLDLLRNIRPKLVYSLPTVRQLMDLDCAILPDLEAAEGLAARLKREIDWQSDRKVERQGLIRETENRTPSVLD